MLEREIVWNSRCVHFIERQRTERLCEAHAESATDGNLVVPVEEVVGVDIVGGEYGNGGILCSRGHSEKIACGTLEEKDASGWCELESESLSRLFNHGLNYATASQRSTKWAVVDR
jgi:hypothetical protein